jgi:myosin III
VSYLLGLEPEEVTEAITKTGIIARGETIVRPNSLHEAIGIRDAIAKALYGRLFSWIVARINYLLDPPMEANAEHGSIEYFVVVHFVQLVNKNCAHILFELKLEM